jgi:hypothetical protein
MPYDEGRPLSIDEFLALHDAAEEARDLEAEHRDHRGWLRTIADELGLLVPPRIPSRANTRKPPAKAQKPAKPPAPILDELPRITRGKHKGERWMTKPQFAAWCGVTVGTVDDWLYTRRIRRDDVDKDGTAQQSRVRIASGARERKGPPVTRKKKAG